MWENGYFRRRTRQGPHTLPTLSDNDFVDCWQEVQNIALQPDMLFPSYDIFPKMSDIRPGIAATFPQLRRISIVVNPFVDLESVLGGEAVVWPPTRRCRLVEAAGDTTWPGRQPEKHWLDTVRDEVELLREPDNAIPLTVQTFEVYVGRQGHKRWKKHPVGEQHIPKALVD